MYTEISPTKLPGRISVLLTHIRQCSTDVYGTVPRNRALLSSSSFLFTIYDHLLSSWRRRTLYFKRVSLNQLCVLPIAIHTKTVFFVVPYFQSYNLSF